MTQPAKKCQLPYHNLEEIQYFCKYPQCKFSRLLCSKCALETTHIHEQYDNSHIVLIQEHDNELLQKIRCSKYRIKEILNANDTVYGAISNNLKYIISSSGWPIVNVWSYQTGKLIKSIAFDNYIGNFRFTEDSSYLYVGAFQKLYQFQANKGFKQKGMKILHRLDISSIYCISNHIILSSSDDGTIIKSDFINQKQLLQIQAHNMYYGIPGLDYNKRRNIIASGSQDQAIKLWNGNDGSLLIQKLMAHNNQYDIIKVLFIIDNDQLISQDSNHQIIIWNIKYQAKNMEIFRVIINEINDISLVLNQQYLLIMDHSYFMKLYNLSLECVKEYYLGEFPLYYTISTQPNSLRAIIFVAKVDDVERLFVCKIFLD